MLLIIIWKNINKVLVFNILFFFSIIYMGDKMRMYLDDIIKVINGNLICGSNTELLNFSINTKEIKKDDIFVGIKGETNDGSNFYLDALEKGAKGVIISKGICKEKVEGKFIIEVDDTTKALQQIAAYKRDNINIPVIGITGSVGKTSTKDMISSVISTKYKVCKTKGNLNNHLGVPLTILSLKDEEVLVVEMGMNHLGEISVLSKIARPDISVITNVGTAHIGNLGSRENILKAKLEILDGMNNGKLIINNDNDMLHSWYLNNRDNVLTVGINNESDYMASNIKYGEHTSFNYNGNDITVKVGGEAFVYNALMGIAVGKLLNIDLEDIKKGIYNLELTKMRLEIVKSQNDFTIINDCYNANYDSMKSSITYLSKMNGNKKIAVLGDMLELGSYSKELHMNVGKVLNENNIDIVILVGELSKYIAKTADNGNNMVIMCKDNKEAADKVLSLANKDDIILIKASNSMNFKEIFEMIK